MSRLWHDAARCCCFAHNAPLLCLLCGVSVDQQLRQSSGRRILLAQAAQHPPGVMTLTSLDLAVVSAVPNDSFDK